VKHLLFIFLLSECGRLLSGCGRAVRYNPPSFAPVDCAVIRADNQLRTVCCFEDQFGTHCRFL